MIRPSKESGHIHRRTGRGCRASDDSHAPGPDWSRSSRPQTGGGAVWPHRNHQEVCGVARKHGLAAHMDGARLLNAVVASGSLHEYAEGFDSVAGSQQGLGAPVGAVLARRDFIKKRRFKHQFGARCIGRYHCCCRCLCAEAPCRRLQEDTTTRLLAQGLADIEAYALNRSGRHTVLRCRQPGNDAEAFARLRRSQNGAGRTTDPCRHPPRCQ